MSVFEPWAGKRVGKFSAPKIPTRRYHFDEGHDESKPAENPIESATVRETPTPANTGAPIPGQRQRGSNITPKSTGAPMPKTESTSSGRIPAKSTKRYPKMDKKQTAPGTRPKKK